MTCEECKQRMYPENPTQPFFIPRDKSRYGQSYYLKPLCDSCPNRYEIEIPKKEVRRPEPQIKRGEFIYLSNKVNEHLDAHKRKRGDEYTII